MMEKITQKEIIKSINLPVRKNADWIKFHSSLKTMKLYTLFLGIK